MMGARGEISAFLALLVIFCGIALEFPFASFVRRPLASRATGKTCEPVLPVALDAETESAIMRKAKDSWRREGAVRKVCTDLFFEELPPMTHTAILSVSNRTRPPSPPAIECPLAPYLPSRKAPPPERIAAESEKDIPAVFSRDDLLKID